MAIYPFLAFVVGFWYFLKNSPLRRASRASVARSGSTAWDLIPWTPFWMFPLKSPSESKWMHGTSQKLKEQRLRELKWRKGLIFQPRGPEARSHTHFWDDLDLPFQFICILFLENVPQSIMKVRLGLFRSDMIFACSAWQFSLNCADKWFWYTFRFYDWWKLFKI